MNECHCIIFFVKPVAVSAWEVKPNPPKRLAPKQLQQQQINDMLGHDAMNDMSTGQLKLLLEYEAENTINSPFLVTPSHFAVEK